MRNTISRRKFLEVGSTIVGQALVGSGSVIGLSIARAASADQKEPTTQQDPTHESGSEGPARLSVRDGAITKGNAPFFPIGFVLDGRDDAAMERAKSYGANSLHTEYSILDLFPDSPDNVAAAGLNKVKSVHSQAAAHGLTLFPLLTGHYIPDWLRKQAGGPPLDAAGNTVGVWFEFSIHDPVFLSLLSRFWTTVASTVGQDPNTGAFVMWNEPCYGLDSTPGALKAYRTWLEKRYHAVADLNVDFNSRFASFSEVVPPASPDAGRAAWYGWGLFNQEAFADFFVNEARIFHSTAPLAKMTNKHPATALQGGSINCNDVVLQDASQDIYGCDRYDSSIYELRDSMELARSLNRKGPVISYEWNPQRAIPPRKAGPSAIQFMAQIIGGVRGLFYYCFDGDPDFAFEAEGTSPEVREAISKLFRLVRDRPDVFAAPRRSAEIAVLLSTPSTIHYGLGPEPSLRDEYTKRVADTFDLLRNQHFAVDFISDRQFAEGKLSRYKLLVIPSLSILPADHLQEIERFQSAGGKLLAFGRTFERDERFNVIPPPVLLGLKSRGPAPWNRGQMYIVGTVPEMVPFFETELIVQNPEQIDPLPRERSIPGTLLHTQGSHEWLAASQDGLPCIVASADGKTVYCSFDSFYGEGLSTLVAGIVETQMGLEREFSAKDGGREAVELLSAIHTTTEGEVLLVANSSAAGGRWKCRMNGLGNTSLKSIITGKITHCESGVFDLALPPYGYEVLRRIA